MRFWLAAALAFAVATGGWLAGVRRQVGTPTPESRWVYEAYSKKIGAADAILSPRVLIVAGSGALFGLDAGRLAAAWGRPVVNMGVNAGLGLSFILWQARQVARHGDLMLLPLEYSLFLDDGAPNAQIIDYALARAPAYWHGLTRWQRLRFAAGLTPDRWWQGLRRPPDQPVAWGIYGGYHIDALGDQTHTSESDQRAADQADVTASRVWDYGHRAGQTVGGWQQLTAFAQWARQTGVCLVAFPPSLLAKPAYRRDAVERQFYESLPEKVRAVGIFYLGRPLDFMDPADWYFNTDYHLKDWARQRHTDRVRALLGSSPWSHCATPAQHIAADAAD